MSDQDYQDGFDQGYESGYADAERAAESVQDDDVDAEIAKLREELVALNADFDTVASAGDQLAARLTTAERELAEARELLGEAADLCHGNDERRELTARIEAFLAKEQA
jgi:hypothetical protein